jgi:1-aminocyclopropane-1-carboxylate deaminase/D-cysteine desulfhydrase-like pyridoxal-dependent ACC family enzyme
MQALGELLAKKLKAEGKNPYVIPVGGSNSLGTWYAVLCQQIQIE